MGIALVLYAKVVVCRIFLEIGEPAPDVMEQDMKNASRVKVEDILKAPNMRLAELVGAQA